MIKFLTGPRNRVHTILIPNRELVCPWGVFLAPGEICLSIFFRLSTVQQESLVLSVAVYGRE